MCGCLIVSGRFVRRRCMLLRCRLVGLGLILLTWTLERRALLLILYLLCLLWMARNGLGIQWRVRLVTRRPCLRLLLRMAFEMLLWYGRECRYRAWLWRRLWRCRIGLCCSLMIMLTRLLIVHCVLLLVRRREGLCTNAAYRLRLRLLYVRWLRLLRLI